MTMDERDTGNARISFNVRSENSRPKTQLVTNPKPIYPNEARDWINNPKNPGQSFLPNNVDLVPTKPSFAAISGFFATNIIKPIIRGIMMNTIIVIRKIPDLRNLINSGTRVALIFFISQLHLSRSFLKNRIPDLPPQLAIKSEDNLN